MKLTAIGVLCLAVCAPAPAQNVRQTFQNPPKAYRPMVRWWWPGGDVTDTELRKEVDLLDQAHFGGAEIQPFDIGLNPDMPAATRKRVDDYLTPEFFAHVRAALEEARAHGMWLDYTFGSGWPFGGAGAVTPELAAVELESAHQTIRGPVHFHKKIQLPEPDKSLAADTSLPSGWEERLREREKLVAVVAVRGEDVQFYPNQLADEKPAVKKTGKLDPGTSVVLTDRMRADGTLDWDVPAGTWQVFVFKEMPTGQKVVGGVGSGPQFVLDHMSKRAFEAYAQRVGGTAKQYDGEFFGNGLRAVFCDSLEVWANLYWSDDFLREFRRQHGYDLTPYLPILKVPGTGQPYSATAAGLPLYDMRGIGDRVRRDYWQTVSDVMFENFYAPFNQWAQDNRLLSRVQAHGSPTDQLRVYGAANIPETEDLYNDGRYDFLKMSSSAADLYGRKIVSSESFVWRGNAYQTTPEKIKRFADELITAGINEIIYHGYPYRYMDRPFPGWHPFAKGGAYSSDMNATNPFTPYFPELNEYITRLQYISQTGTTVVPVALYRHALAYDSIEPAQPEPEINTRLMEAGYNFDHIDAFVLLQCHVTDGKLVSPGGEKYSVLILPDQKSVSGKVADQLAAFAKEGLPILFVGRPPVIESPEIKDGQLKAVSVSNPLQRILAVRNVYSVSGPKDAVKVLTGAVQPNLHFEGLSVPFIEKRIGDLGTFFLRNPDDAEKNITVDFAAPDTPEIWNPWTGEIESAANVERHGNTVQVRLDMDAYGSVLLVFDPAAKPSAASFQKQNGRMLTQIGVGRNGWKFHGVGIGPGSQPETIDLSMPDLMDWTLNDKLKNFSGRGEYTTTFTVPPGFLGTNQKVILDLGDVKDVAEISINGKKGSVLLMRPYQADVTGLVHSGNNTVHITVVNTLFNALSARGASANYTPETTNTASGLMPSGLIGPVRLESMRRP
jgi:hypothetical protein